MEEKRRRYSKILLEAYNSGILKIIWSTSGFSIAVDSKKEEMISELKKEEFVEYAFSIFKMVIDLAEGRETDKRCEEDLEIAGSILEKEYDLRNHLYIKRNSKLDCFKLLEYEIISHRNEEDPQKIESASAIIKLAAESEGGENICTFEASRRDLKDIIDKLIELKEKMDMI